MKTENIKLVSEYDGLTLTAVVSTPNYNPIGIVQIIHGMMESRFKYHDAIEMLVESGYVVIIADLRGHGNAVDLNHPYGYFAYQDGWLNNLKEMHLFAQIVRERYRNLPFFILGHSMGALIARSYIKRYEDEVSGVILSGSPAHTIGTGALNQYLELMIKREGPTHPSNFFHQTYFGGLDKKFNEGSYSWISHDEDVVADYRDDPLCGFVFTHSGVKDLMFGIRDVYVNNDWRVLKPYLPILFIVGSDDACANYPKGINHGIKKLQKHGYKNISVNLYSERRHVLLSGEGFERPVNDVIDWLNSVVQKR